MHEEKRPLTVSEAGRRGGEATKERYGLDHYKTMGSKGGEMTKAKYGPEHYSEIGRKGGAKRKKPVPDVIDG